jgi:hypothetical protein
MGHTTMTDFRIFKKASGIFFIQDRATGRQESLRTRDKREAERLLNARNDAAAQPLLNIRLARTYFSTADPDIANRTWSHVIEQIIKTKAGDTRNRWARVFRDYALRFVVTLKNYLVASNRIQRNFAFRNLGFRRTE